MRVEVRAERVIKESESEAERARLGVEARALRACAHPGVVPLLGSDGGDPPCRLVLAPVAGGALAGAGGCLALEVVAGLAAAIAATLADLHDLGWVHGALAADHVLLDDEGRPVLCGFGRASRPSTPSEMEALAAGDVAALTSMLAQRLPAHPDRRVARLFAASGGPRMGRTHDARRLARRVIDLVPDARLEPAASWPEGCSDRPGPTEPAPVRAIQGSRAGRRLALVGGGGAAAVLVAGLAVSGFLARPSSPPSPPQPDPPARSPGGRPAPVGRYVLSNPGGGRLITVMGRWGCGPARPAALDLSSGWVWIFDGWPGPGSSLRGRAVVRRPGAMGLAVEEVRARCDHLVVLGRSGTSFTVPGSEVAPGP